MSVTRFYPWENFTGTTYTEALTAIKDFFAGNEITSSLFDISDTIDTETAYSSANLTLTPKAENLNTNTFKFEFTSSTQFKFTGYLKAGTTSKTLSVMTSQNVANLKATPVWIIDEENVKGFAINNINLYTVINTASNIDSGEKYDVLISGLNSSATENLYIVSSAAKLTSSASLLTLSNRGDCDNYIFAQAYESGCKLNDIFTVDGGNETPPTSVFEFNGTKYRNLGITKFAMKVKEG